MQDLLTSPNTANHSDRSIGGGTTDLFMVPDEDREPILYAPLVGRLFRVNPALADRIGVAAESGQIVGTSDPALFKWLERHRLLADPDGSSPFDNVPIHDRFEPTGLILLATTLCNLRCRYCYADGGDLEPALFDREIAEAGMKLVIDNAIRLGESVAYLAFHGGGEPTQDFRLIQDAVVFARTYCAQSSGGAVRVDASLVTNGVVSEKKARWLAAHIDSIQVSLDGPRDLHDMHRPRQDGASTHDRVVRTAKIFEDAGCDLIIKSTISRSTVAQMAEIAEYMCQTFSIPRFHFGPVIEAGRGKSDLYGQPDVVDFIEGYAAAQEVASKYGRRIVVSGALETFPQIRSTYCGVTDPNFAVNVNGTVTSCYEVIYDDDPRAHRFHYGRYDHASGRFEIDHARLLRLRSNDVTSIRKCRDCFAKWHCAGDCQARWFNSDDGTDEVGVDMRCELNRELIRRELVRIVDSA